MTQPTPEAIAGARAAATKWRIPASSSLAQWADESDWGRRPSGKNNPFGITAALNGQGRPMVPATLVATHEEVNGKLVARQRWFRDFDSVAAAFDYHGKLLATSAYYASAIAALPNLARFISLMAQHYATDSGYAAKLMMIIRGANLTRYDA